MLKLLDPTYRPEPEYTNPRRGSAHGGPFRHGEMTAAALEALRTLKRPASSAECAAAMLKRKGIGGDPDRQATLTSRVSAVFAQKADTGQIRHISNGDARNVLWEVAR